MQNIYKLATKTKLRFPSKKGLITTEDLFDLPLTSTISTKDSIDSVSQAVLATKDAAKQKSLVSKSKTSEITKLQIAILEDVIETKETEAKAKQNAQAARSELSEIDAALAEKKSDKIKAMSPSALEARRKELLAQSNG